MGLSAKRQRFVDEYLVDLNGSQAAIRAGYSERTAAQQATRLLRDAHAQAAIEAGMAARAKRTAISQDRVLQELALLAFARSGEFFKWTATGVELVDRDKLTDEQAAAVAEISQTVTQHGGTIRLKLHDKVAALTLLGKHVGLFGDKLTLGGELTIVNQDAIPRPQTYEEWLRYQQQALADAVSPPPATNGNGHASG